MPSRGPKRFLSRHRSFLALVALVLASAARAESEGIPSVREILDRALEVQRINRESGIDVKFDYEILNVSEKLDDDGEIDETEERLYVSHHIGDVPYERLVRKDGEGLTEKEIEQEDEREEEFRKKVESGGWEDGEEDDRIVFDERLISRYDIELDRIRPLAGRDCYVLAYEPRNGKLPNDKRLDRVLNKSSGTLWIDTDTFEVARVEFDLDEKVGLWFGIIGSISEMTGRFDRRPVADGAWLPDNLELYLRGRILFRGLHVREKVEWRGFTPRTMTDDR